MGFCIVARLFYVLLHVIIDMYLYLFQISAHVVKCLEAKKSVGLKRSNISFPHIQTSYAGKEIPALSLGEEGQVNLGEMLESIPYENILQDLEEMTRSAAPQDHDLVDAEVRTHLHNCIHTFIHKYVTRKYIRTTYIASKQYSYCLIACLICTHPTRTSSLTL